jgi:[acyl-carrier-protein] S-malonyltransferase
MQDEGAAISIANINSPSQVVVSGATAAIAEFQTRAGKAGLRRITRLQVSGAWHSAMMKDCEASFAELIGEQPITDPAVPVFSNVSATPATRRAEVTAALIDQLSAPVLWLQSLRRLRAAYPDAVFAEIGPGKVLTGLLLQTDPRAKIFRINSRRGLERFAEAIA